MRALVRETNLNINDLVYPLFITATKQDNNPIESMPGQYQITLNNLPSEIRTLQQLGVRAVLLFGIPKVKDLTGSDSYSASGIIQTAVKIIKDITDQILVITDVCLCEYTTHGHCGIMNEKTGQIDLDNDETIEVLQQQVLSHVQAGSDVVAPSGMIDGCVKAARNILNNNNFAHIPIMGYTIKYSSALYSPFRHAAEGAPQFGDRSTYQMDCANSDEAIRECMLDIEEGVDILMVKPALAYLDIINKVKQKFPELPLAAYQVSGEYSMIKAAAANGWIDEQKVMLESLIAIKRAGANFIISYFTKDVIKLF
jgi:porphobilinogen synthase